MKKTVGKIGNIITSGSGKGFPKIFNICKNMGDVDASLPILIIGLQEAKAILGRRFSIIERRPKERVWWTYKETEQKNEYDEDYSSFYNHCIYFKLGKIRYSYVNFTRYRYSKIKSFIQYTRNKKKKICFITRDRNFIFIYVPTDKIVLGLSLTLLEYCGIPKDKSIKRLKENKNNVFMKDTAFLDDTLRNIVGNKTHYIPILSELFSEN